jgi:hypothetical protein
MNSTKKMTPTLSKPTMQLTSVYCEADTLTLCRARFGSIRAALNYAVNQSTNQTKHNASIQNNQH